MFPLFVKIVNPLKLNNFVFYFICGKHDEPIRTNLCKHNVILAICSCKSRKQAVTLVPKQRATSHTFPSFHNFRSFTILQDFNIEFSAIVFGLLWRGLELVRIISFAKMIWSNVEWRRGIFARDTCVHTKTPSLTANLQKASRRRNSYWRRPQRVLANTF